jgi:hypothetical protein
MRSGKEVHPTTPFRKDGDNPRHHQVGAKKTGISPGLQKTTPLDAPQHSTGPRHHDLAITTVVSP